jgi:hypothetical protein
MDSIRTVLELIRGELNTFLQNADRREEDWVILSNVVDHEGHAFESAKDKIVITLANITHETVTLAGNQPPGQGGAGAVHPPLYIDLFLLFLANFRDRNYLEGLSLISRTIGFFQQNPVFTRANMPGLDHGIDKLTMELTNLSLSEIRDLMSMLGMKYLPSVCYKLRMITFAGEPMQVVAPAARRM